MVSENKQRNSKYLELSHISEDLSLIYNSVDCIYLYSIHRYLIVYRIFLKN